MRDNWKTPKWLYSFFKDYSDPCIIETNTIHSVDMLGSDWKNPSFVNPPYSNPLEWIEKSIKESKKGVNVLLLLKVDCSTKWYRLLVENNAHFCYFNERLKFDDCSTGANFPSMLVFLPGVVNNER